MLTVVGRGRPQSWGVTLAVDRDRDALVDCVELRAVLEAVVAERADDSCDVSDDVDTLLLLLLLANERPAAASAAGLAAGSDNLACHVNTNQGWQLLHICGFNHG